VLSFLKQAALEAEWTPTYLVSTLGVNHETGKQIAAELSLVGYAEPVPRKRETYRNTPAGNKVAGARHPSLV